MQAKVSVVIPNYNGCGYLENCVESLLKQSVRCFEIIIVDDASADDSFHRIREKYPECETYPQIRYLSHTRNLGFCRAVNDGIRAAKADYIFLLNNDTMAEPDCILELYRAIRSSDRIFSAGARMVSMKNPDVMDDGGDYYCSLGWAFTPSKDKPANRYRTNRRIFSACGGAVMYRKELLEKTGLFDENHFAYLEDVDLGYRARLHGYENILAAHAVVLHAGSASSGSRYNAFKAELTARNNLYLLYKNMPDWQLALNFVPIVAGTIIKMVFYCKKGFGKAYGKGLLEGFRLCRTQEGQGKRLPFKQIGMRRIWRMQLVLMLNTIRRLDPTAL